MANHSLTISTHSTVVDENISGSLVVLPRQPSSFAVKEMTQILGLLMDPITKPLSDHRPLIADFSTIFESQGDLHATTLFDKLVAESKSCVVVLHTYRQKQTS